MGWYGKGVMDGDPPYEARAKIEYICRGESFNDDDYEFSDLNADELDSNILDIIPELKDPIEWQVLGYLIIEAGAHMSDFVRENVLKSIEFDKWAHEDDKRKWNMNRFSEQVLNYNGTPSRITYRMPIEIWLELTADKLQSNDTVVISVSQSIWDGDFHFYAVYSADKLSDFFEAVKTEIESKNSFFGCFYAYGQNEITVDFKTYRGDEIVDLWVNFKLKFTNINQILNHE